MKGTTFENILDFNMIGITEIINKEKNFQINEMCRNNKIAFIYCEILGLSEFSFVDFVNEHVIFHDNGEDNKTCENLLWK